MPAVEGLFTIGDEPRLIGGRVPGTESYFFPKHLGGADPRVGPVEVEEVLLSRRGRVWSYTTSHYPPPPPFVVDSEPYEPITVAAVELEAEKMVVLGQCVAGVGPDDLEVGMEMELTVDTLYRDDDCDYLVWKWRPAAGNRRTRAMEEIAVLGAGMHPWGKWGRNFTEYGVAAARDALADAAVDYADVGFVSGAVTVRCGYPGYVAGSTFARALGFTGAQLASSYSACASGATALQVARGQILSGACDVALVVGADTTPKGFLAPNAGDRPDDIDWLRFRLVGATNPVYFGLHARRRMDLYGATTDDFAMVKVKNSRHGAHNPNARFTKEYGLDDVRNSPVVSDPLRLLDICATSDGGAALVVSSMEWARDHGRRDPVRVAGISTVSPTYPDPVIDLPYLAADSLAGASAPPDRLQGVDRRPGLRRGRARPRRHGRGRGVRPVVRDGARLVRAARLLRGRRGREAAARRRHRRRRPAAGQPQRRPGRVRRGRPGPGHRPGLRAGLAAAGHGRRPPGGRRQGRHHRQPGPLRPRLVGDRPPLTPPEAAAAESAAPRPQPTPRGSSSGEHPRQL